ncbi:MAG: acyl-CoA thioesterase [Deltaproteobacteria bacterium]|nr:MAG: acyl-CoA thioesterase [Deltaproteobacteria bacterium]
MPIALPLHVPRHAFSVRERARAGDLWRAFQEAAVLGSSALGWPPHRYRAEGCAFVVRRMTVLHHSELRYGEPLQATTWVRTFARGLITHREIRLDVPGDRPIARATQEWVHVSFGLDDGEVKLRACRASQALQSAFVLEDLEPPPELPSTDEPVDGPTHPIQIPLRHTEMDPLGHLNHPAYVDLADEHTTLLLVERGLDPVGLQPIAEQVLYRTGLSAPGPLTLQTRLLGRAGAGLAIAHRFLDPQGGLAAEATTVRTLYGQDPSLLEAALR